FLPETQPILTEEARRSFTRQQKGPSARMSLCILKTRNNSGRLNHKIVRQLEANNRLRRNVDVPIPRQPTDCRASACASQPADQQARTSSRHAANQHSQPRATANERGRPFALALLRARQV